MLYPTILEAPCGVTDRSGQDHTKRPPRTNEVEERTNARIKEQDFVCHEAGEEDWYRVAYYSGLSASLSLESKLRDLGWTVKRSPLAQLTEPSRRIGVTLERGAAQVEASGRSFEEALARAALEVVA